MRRFVLILLCIIAVFASSVAADMSMTGPSVDAKTSSLYGYGSDIVKVYAYVQTSSGSKLVLQEIKPAGYGLHVEATADADGNGWIGVRGSGSLNSSPTKKLTAQTEIERVGWWIFDGEETVTADCYGSFETETQTGSFILTGKGLAAASAGGNSMSFGAAGFQVGSGSGSISIPGSFASATTSISIAIREEYPTVYNN